MRKFVVNIKASKEESYSLLEDEKKAVFSTLSIHLREKDESITHNIWSVLDSYEIYPDNDVIDFCNLALGVYSLDQLVSREEHGYLNWSRDFEIHLPVTSLTKWENCKVSLEAMLSFLSGDKWMLHFRERETVTRDKESANLNIVTTSLFSGGMDSYIGAIKFLSDDQKVAFVGHHKSGPNELPYQNSLIDGLREVFGKENVNPFMFHVQPTKDKNFFKGENTQRARSLLFIALGILVSNAINPSGVLQVPENGLISLNIPLTKARIGSYSTRTTHPHFFDLLNTCLDNIGISNRVINPFYFDTKGEMLEKFINVQLLKDTAKDTVSCARPGHYRRWKRKANRIEGEVIPVHCGYCTPCIIRRAAMHKVGLDSKDEYVMDVITDTLGSKSSDKMRDLTAFKIGIARFREELDSLSFKILESGPIPGDEETLDKFIRVYRNGITEVSNFLFRP